MLFYFYLLQSGEVVLFGLSQPPDISGTSVE
jgi:hypothetical protein